MKITLLSNRDLASHMALSLLSQGLSEGLTEHLAGHRLSIFLSEKVGADKRLPQPLMELAAFERQLLDDGRPSFDELAAECRLSVAGVWRSG